MRVSSACPQRHIARQSIHAKMSIHAAVTLTPNAITAVPIKFVIRARIDVTQCELSAVTLTIRQRGRRVVAINGDPAERRVLIGRPNRSVILLLLCDRVPRDPAVT